MRGRVIFPFLCTIAQLDTQATAADPDGAGQLTSGYDDDFRETVLLPASNAQGFTDARQEQAPLDLKCQIEPEMLDQLQMMLSGNSPKQGIMIVCHFADLEVAGLVDLNGQATLRKGDRLVTIKTADGDFIQDIPTPPGLYLVDIRYGGYGIGRSRNLLFLRFEERATSSASAG